MNGELEETNAPSGQSTKLGNVARNVALLRYSAGTEFCAAAIDGEVIATNETAMAMTKIATTLSTCAQRRRPEHTSSPRPRIRL